MSDGNGVRDRSQSLHVARGLTRMGIGHEIVGVRGIATLCVFLSIIAACDQEEVPVVVERDGIYGACLVDTDCPMESSCYYYSHPSIEGSVSVCAPICDDDCPRPDQGSVVCEYVRCKLACETNADCPEGMECSLPGGLSVCMWPGPPPPPPEVEELLQGGQLR